MEILNSIQNEFSNIEKIRNSMIVAKKIQLHSGIDGYDSPQAYGIYRNNGGQPLGVVGKDFEPMDLNIFLDVIIQSCVQADLDMSKLSYKEYANGSKVIFELPLKQYQIATPMLGDTLATKLQFKTGFDGLTKVSLGFYAYRLWCSNGAKGWRKDIDLSFKNTYGNKGKIALFTNEIISTISNVEKYTSDLGKLTKIAVTQKDIDIFFKKLTGNSLADDKELTTRKRNILDKINQSVAIEMQNTGANMFSLLQGITRYTTHEMANASEEKLMFTAAAKYSDKAHELAFEYLN